MPGRAGLPDRQGVHFALGNHDSLAASKVLLAKELILFVLTCPGEVLGLVALLVGHDTAACVVGEPDDRAHIHTDVELLAGLLCDLAGADAREVTGVVHHFG